jgi:integrase
LVDFGEKVFLPLIEPNLRPSSARSYRITWRNQIKPFIRRLWTKQVKTKDVQRALNLMARAVDDEGRTRFGISSVKRAKTFYHAMFKVASSQGYYPDTWRNPCDGVFLPAARPAEETYAYSLAEIEQMIAQLPEPAATIVAVAAYTGARRSEIQGMLWENYDGLQIQITRSVWHGIASPPKTKKSRAPIPIIKPLAARLTFHRERCGNPVEGPIFRNMEGKPECLSNVLNRVILPALNRCAMCSKSEAEHRKHPVKFDDHEYIRDERLPRWHGWHAFRRALGSNLYALGVPDKVIQAILRHANVSTTMTHYVKTSGEAEQAAMNRLELALLDRNQTEKKAISATATLQ